MKRYDEIKEAMETLEKYWGEDGKNVAVMCLEEPLNMTGPEFLQNCTACGGNWGGMLLSGIKFYDRALWEAIPENMGTYAWVCICSMLTLLKVDFTKE